MRGFQNIKGGYEIKKKISEFRIMILLISILITDIPVHFIMKMRKKPKFFMCHYDKEKTEIENNKKKIL